MHLMYAVKEEISALKDKVEDLEQKVFRLEWENRILREHADAETLALVESPQQGMLNGPAGVQESAALPAASETAASS